MARKATKERSESEKRADFVKLANKHAGTAVKALGRLSALARPNRYSFSESDAEQIAGVIAQHVERMKDRLTNPPTKAGEGELRIVS